MISWLVGAKSASDTTECVDDTRIEPPETPAPVFAVRAVKHAIWGTPQPVPTIVSTKLPRKTKPHDNDITNGNPELKGASDTEAEGCSPTKAGILMTPGTLRGKKKEVTFGVHVVDNQGKKISRSGLPNDFPGKFPSPWTPRVAGISEQKQPKTKLNAVLYDTEIVNTKQGIRAKDDVDITIDIMEPRSESGRHWKAQYVAYQSSSEEQIRKLNSKYNLCKEHAKRKDDEANTYRRQLENISKRSQLREKELEDQVKDLREQLRLQMADNLKTSTEISVLRKRIGHPSLETGTERLNRALQKLGVTESASRQTVGKADDEKDNEEEKAHTYLQAAVVHTRGERAQLDCWNEERQLARQGGTVARCDSATTSTTQLATDISELECSPTPRLSKPLRRILADMSPNIASSPPISSFFSDPNQEEIMAKATNFHYGKKQQQQSSPPSPTHREAMAEAAASLSHQHEVALFEISAPSSAHQVQAKQVHDAQLAPLDVVKRDHNSFGSSMRHKRSEATWTAPALPAGLDEERARAAKDRLQAKRAKKRSRLQ